MRLLLDNDAFVKLASSDLLEPVIEVLGVTSADCRRLPSLPHMLRRGAFARRLSDVQREKSLTQTTRIAAIEAGDPSWLERMLRVQPPIDPGEAQLFSILATDPTAALLTGDKRAMKAVGTVEGLAAAITGRVICLEVALIVICSRLGVEVVRVRAQGALSLDMVMQVCFMSNDPVDSLRHYLEAHEREVIREILWHP